MADDMRPFIIPPRNMQSRAHRVHCSSCLHSLAGLFTETIKRLVPAQKEVLPHGCGGCVEAISQRVCNEDFHFVGLRNDDHFPISPDEILLGFHFYTTCVSWLHRLLQPTEPRRTW